MSTPAGETPQWIVTLAENTVDELEIEAVTAVLRSGWLSAGPRTLEFERAFAAMLGVPAAVAVSSGTAALHLAILAMDLAPGDEVIVPSLTFVASAAMVALQGGTPVFADICSERDLTVDPDSVARLIGPRTRAIVAMHYAGFPADLAALRVLADRHGLVLIEDAAHAPGVRAGDGMLGAFGDIGCFSFFATKNLTTGEGGMVVARDARLLAGIRQARSHCLTTSTWDRLRSADGGYDVTGIGLNYRPTEIASALGIVQLGRLGEDRVRRRRLVAVYRDALRHIPGLVIPFLERTGDSAHHLMAVLLPSDVDRGAVRTALAAAGVQTSVHYPATHQFSYYRSAFANTGPLPVTDAVVGRLLSLPLHARMTDEQAAMVAEALAEALAEAVRA